jgi:hypothetical protein
MRGEAMSCYLRHLGDVMARNGIEVTKDNRKRVDQAIHKVVGVRYKDCPQAWKAVKAMIAEDEANFIASVKAELER